MARKLLEIWELNELEARVERIGREFYQIMEDWPIPVGWSYVDSFAVVHQLIYDEAMELKKAAMAASADARE
jgi:hypothetical protein